MSDLRLHMFQCGSLKCKLHNIKMNQGLNEPYEIPVPWFLIQHPKGNIVIDGGNAVECVGDPYAYQNSGFRIQDSGARSALRARGVHLHAHNRPVGFPKASKIDSGSSGAGRRLPTPDSRLLAPEF
jgi:hypothetical protein